MAWLFPKSLRFPVLMSLQERRLPSVVLFWIEYFLVMQVAQPVERLAPKHAKLLSVDWLLTLPLAWIYPQDSLFRRLPGP